jgi:hypothetical protein
MITITKSMSSASDYTVSPTLVRSQNADENPRSGLENILQELRPSFVPALEKA